jgi:hypothetical protein
MVVTGPRGVAFIIDISGSMNERTAGGSTKIAEAKDATIRAIDMLEPSDMVSVYTFDSDAAHPVQTVLAGAGKEAAKRKVRGLQAGGMTQIAPALEMTNMRPGMTWRNILLTDGNSTVNQGGDERRCLQLVGTPGAAPIGVFGLGVDYNDAYLSQLAGAGQAGSFYQHVSDASVLAAKFQEQMNILTSSGAVSNVQVSFVTANGITISDAVRLVPDQQDLTVEMGGTRVAYQHGDLDGVYGQKILLKLEIPQGLPVGRLQLGDWAVQFNAGGQRGLATDGVFVEITNDESQAGQLDPSVMRTFFTVQGTRLTTRGDYGAAADLMTRAGNTQAANQLQTLVGGRADENSRRSTNTLLTNLGKTISS